MSKNQKFGVVVYPRDQDFQITVGSTNLGSRTYASSSNAYRGARAAIRNIRNRNISNASNYGDHVVAVTNSNGFVIAATSEFGRPASAKQSSNKILEQCSKLNLKKTQLQVVRD